MKAMILAAGLGTRLKPLTDRIPKALVEVEGVPMLERVILSLKRQGFNRIVVNTYHFPEQIKDFLSSKDFGVSIDISDETGELLDTGGGIVKAMPLIFKDDNSPVLIHNVDILSNADLRNVMKESEKSEGSVLLVSDRDSSRKLIFDSAMELKGWHDLKNGRYRPEEYESFQEESDNEYAFSGIYAMSYEAIEEMKNLLGTGRYSVMEYFLNSGRKENIKGFLQSGLKLIDIGKPATLAQASELLKDSNLDFFN
ncbi:MAG: nucleotidyltransferase family protein [Muribaculaceae bacterium]|nr:nucleotidyltransferase family protein [Muribaculaceae bacterium]